jgi:hypothetical protein
MLGRIGHTLLALLLLVSTTGFNVSLHYCQHRLYDVGIFSQAENCCASDNQHQKKSHHYHHCGIDHPVKSKCEDKTIHFVSIDHFLLSSTQTDLTNLTSLGLISLKPIIAAISGLLNDLTGEIPERGESPPLIQTDISFLKAYLL